MRNPDWPSAFGVSVSNVPPPSFPQKHLPKWELQSHYPVGSQTQGTWTRRVTGPLNLEGHYLQDPLGEAETEGLPRARVPLAATSRSPAHPGLACGSAPPEVPAGAKAPLGAHSPAPRVVQRLNPGVGCSPSAVRGRGREAESRGGSGPCRARPGFWLGAGCGMCGFGDRRRGLEGKRCPLIFP